MGDGHLSGGFDKVVERCPFGGLCVGNSSRTQEPRVLKANLVALSASNGHCNEECASS